MAGFAGFGPTQVLGVIIAVIYSAPAKEPASSPPSRPCIPKNDRSYPGLDTPDLSLASQKHMTVALRIRLFFR